MKKIEKSPHPVSRKLFMASFDHSQGADTAQTLIGKYLHAAFPYFTLSTNHANELISSSYKPTQQILATPQRHKPLTESKPQLEKEAKNFWHIFNTDEQIHIDQIIRWLCIAFTCRDWIYKDGRPRIPDPRVQHYDPRRDPYLSFLCHYGFQRHTTGIPEFNKMYRDIIRFLRVSSPEQLGERELWRSEKNSTSNQITNLYAPASNAAKLEEVIAAYNLHHPNQRPVNSPWGRR